MGMVCSEPIQKHSIDGNVCGKCSGRVVYEDVYDEGQRLLAIRCFMCGQRDYIKINNVIERSIPSYRCRICGVTRTHISENDHSDLCVYCGIQEERVAKGLPPISRDRAKAIRQNESAKRRREMKKLIHECKHCSLPVQAKMYNFERGSVILCDFHLREEREKSKKARARKKLMRSCTEKGVI